MTIQQIKALVMVSVAGTAYTAEITLREAWTNIRYRSIHRDYIAKNLPELSRDEITDIMEWSFDSLLE